MNKTNGMKCYFKHEEAKSPSSFVRLYGIATKAIRGLFEKGDDIRSDVPVRGPVYSKKMARKIKMNKTLKKR